MQFRKTSEFKNNATRIFAIYELACSCLQTILIKKTESNLQNSVSSYVSNNSIVDIRSYPYRVLTHVAMSTYNGDETKATRTVNFNSGRNRQVSTARHGASSCCGSVLNNT